jgi:hypothetical protein
MFLQVDSFGLVDSETLVPLSCILDSVSVPFLREKCPIIYCNGPKAKCTRSTLQ